MDIKQYTEDSITLIFGEEISPELNKKIVNTRKYIDRLKIEGIIETIISYTRLVIYFDPIQINHHDFIKRIKEINFEAIEQESFAYRVVEIPVCYGGQYGPDVTLFEKNGITIEKLIELHANKEYLVYMLGFMPGFVYLGGLDQSLFMDRLDSPRTNIAAGSVGIAGQQTGVYPFDSPGGWNLIGRTPIKLYDTSRGEDTILYEAGDRIIFKPITIEQYTDIENRIKDGTYTTPIHVKGGDQ